MKFAVISLCIVWVSAVPFVKKQSPSNARIIGGDPAQEGQFPWEAAVYYGKEDGSSLCGGALIDPKWVLTSANCIDGAKDFLLLLGTNTLNTGGITIDAYTYVTHPDYNSETLENDIGLVKIDDGVELNDTIQVIPLASDDLQSDLTVIVTGWGVSDQEMIVNELNFINLTTISNDDCKSTYGMPIMDQMVCATGNRADEICLGDEGSPLIMQDASGKSVHVGVAGSASANECSVSLPSVYTRTASYREWIVNVTSST